MNRLLSVALILTVFGCGPTSLEDGSTEAAPSSVASPIVGGTIAQGDPAVVALVAFGQQYCTGTLIGPKTVLTAAHCINRNGPTNGRSARFGTRVSAPTLIVPIVAQYRHPDYNSESLTADIGVVQLGTRVENIRPIPLNDTRVLQSDIGKEIRHVGFGATSGSGGGNGTKRETSYPLRQVLPTYLESGGMGTQTCSGDSGGPAFMILGDYTGERVAGVVSFGDSNCTQFGADTRVDVYETWVRQTYESWDPPSCELDGRCIDGCASLDPDCACTGDGQCLTICPRAGWDPDCPRFCDSDSVCSTESCPRPDPDCTLPGKSCSAPEACEAGLCLDRPAGAYCSRPCNDACPIGMTCGADDLCYLENDRVVIELAVARYQSGCSSTAGGPSWLLVFGLLAFALRHRRFARG